MDPEVFRVAFPVLRYYGTRTPVDFCCYVRVDHIILGGGDMACVVFVMRNMHVFQLWGTVLVVIIVLITPATLLSSSAV